MFERILVPLDGSSLAECVLPHIAAMGKLGPVQAVFLHVLDQDKTGGHPRGVDAFEWQLRKAESEAYLNKIGPRLSESGIRADYEVLEGRVAESILQYSESGNFDLIVVSSHGQSGLTGWNVSSVVQKIIFRAELSILLVPAYQPILEQTEAKYRRILVPLDGSQRAEYALPAAAAIARAHGAELLAVHVVRKPEMPRRTPASQEDIDLSNQLVERNRVEASRYLEEAKNRLDQPVETQVVISDNVTATLHDMVQHDAVDLVLLSAHGYTGGARWPFGSIVTSFINYGTSPLLIIQDLPRGTIEPTKAELAARQAGGR